MITSFLDYRIWTFIYAQNNADITCIFYIQHPAKFFLNICCCLWEKAPAARSVKIYGVRTWFLLLPLSLEIRRETAEIWHGAPLTPYRLDTKGIFHLQFRGAEKNGHEFLQLMLLEIEPKSYFCHCHYDN